MACIYIHEKFDGSKLENMFLQLFSVTDPPKMAAIYRVHIEEAVYVITPVVIMIEMKFFQF